MEIKEWMWRMSFCKQRALNPSEKWAWELAGKMYEEMCNRGENKYAR